MTARSPLDTFLLIRSVTGMFNRRAIMPREAVAMLQACRDGLQGADAAWLAQFDRHLDHSSSDLCRINALTLQRVREIRAWLKKRGLRLGGPDTQRLRLR